MDRKNQTTIMKVKDSHKDLLLETLSNDPFNKLNGKFIEENMIIIDNSMVKHIFNN